jgi:hypothetical protein
MKVQVSEQESVSVCWNIQPYSVPLKGLINYGYYSQCVVFGKSKSGVINEHFDCRICVVLFFVVCFCFCCFHVYLLLLIWIAKGENVCGWLYNSMLQYINNLIVLKSCFQLLVENMLPTCSHSVTVVWFCMCTILHLEQNEDSVRWRKSVLESSLVTVFIVKSNWTSNSKSKVTSHWKQIQMHKKRIKIFFCLQTL